MTRFTFVNSLTHRLTGLAVLSAWVRRDDTHWLRFFSTRLTINNGAAFHAYQVWFVKWSFVVNVGLWTPGVKERHAAR